MTLKILSYESTVKSILTYGISDPPTQRRRRNKFLKISIKNLCTMSTGARDKKVIFSSNKFFLNYLVGEGSRVRLFVGGSEIPYVGILLTVLSYESIFEVIWVLLPIHRFISVGYHSIQRHSQSRFRT